MFGMEVEQLAGVAALIAGALWYARKPAMAMARGVASRLSGSPPVPDVQSARASIDEALDYAEMAGNAEMAGCLREAGRCSYNDLWGKVSPREDAADE